MKGPLRYPCEAWGPDLCGNRQVQISLFIAHWHCRAGESGSSPDTEKCVFLQVSSGKDDSVELQGHEKVSDTHILLSWYVCDENARYHSIHQTHEDTGRTAHDLHHHISCRHNACLESLSHFKRTGTRIRTSRSCSIGMLFQEEGLRVNWQLNQDSSMVQRQARDMEVRVRVPVQVPIFILKCDNVNVQRHKLCLYSLNNLILRQWRI